MYPFQHVPPTGVTNEVKLILQQIWFNVFFFPYTIRPHQQRHTHTQASLETCANVCSHFGGTFFSYISDLIKVLSTSAELLFLGFRKTSKRRRKYNTLDLQEKPQKSCIRNSRWISISKIKDIFKVVYYAMKFA